LLSPQFLNIDNNGAISIATTPKMSVRIKHIGVKYHFVKDLFRKKRNPDHHPFALKKINTVLQKADIFTNGLNENSQVTLSIWSKRRGKLSGLSTASGQTGTQHRQCWLPLSK
jgi:hypothetical protein